ncbi:MAG: sulfurtransferase [Rhodospirillales bacterium]|nr:sulfurtransferase [Rhodospirillales bacterium]
MEYQNPQALVSTVWLVENLNTDGVRIVDASYFMPGAKRNAKEEFAAQHIPGAVFFDIDDVCLPASDHMLPDAEMFSAKVGALGIGNGDKVVVYDSNNGGMAAARVWWTFRVFGHDNVCLLNGSLKAWLAEGRPVTNEAPAPGPATFAAVKNDAMVRDINQMLANVESGAEQVIDARSKERFDGIEIDKREGARSGHIPGSFNIPFNTFFDKDRNCVMRDAEELTQTITAAGCDLNRPITATCGSGVTASMLAFGLFLLGREDVPVYDGSWSEWGIRPDTPVEP